MEAISAISGLEADCVQIYLAMEEKEDKSAFKAQSLITTFEDSFYKMSYTIHPAGIPGEAQGKSSNESWAGKQACKDYPDAALKQNIIVTTMDGQWDSLRFMCRLLTVCSGYTPLISLLPANCPHAHRVCRNKRIDYVRPTVGVRPEPTSRSNFGPYGRYDVGRRWTFQSLPGLSGLHPDLSLLSTHDTTRACRRLGYGPRCNW